jgi:Tfp pilus assembly protein PilF
VAAVLLAGLTLAVFLQIGRHPFIGLDDDVYLAGNPWVARGLTIAGWRWAWSLSTFPYWHPLTWLSHMADVQLFGLHAGGHHLVSLALHTVTGVLIALTLWRLTGRLWRSVTVAALFSIHPLHVESVAWAAERKDVLSALFFALSVAAYLSFRRRPGTKRALLVAGAFVLGLLAKPMIVTLPLVLLLVDFWPLGLLRGGGDGARAQGAKLLRLAVEKLPLVALAVPVAVVTVVVQRKFVLGANAFTLGERLANAAVAPAAYLFQTIWPARLAVFYPHPASLGQGLPAWKVAGGVALVAALSWVAVRTRRSRPWLALGWSWFLVTLTPVLGIVQNWDQARADRFTYLPLVGIFVAVVWEAAEAARRRRLPGPVLPTVTVALLLLLAAAAHRQASYWSSDAALFGRAIAVTSDNWLAHASLGRQLLIEGREAEAEPHLREALRLRPVTPLTHYNLAIVLERTGRLEEAVREYEQAIAQNPDYLEALNNLGALLVRMGRYADALRPLGRALARQPVYSFAHFNAGQALEGLGRTGEAAQQYEEALRDDPSHAGARNALGAIRRRAASRGEGSPFSPAR